MRPFQGDLLAPGFSGDRQVAALPASKAAPPPIQINRFVRNGRHPQAVLESLKAEHANHAAMFRPKEIFSSGRITYNGGAATTEQWRFAFRTSPLTHAIWCRFDIGPPQPSSGITGYATLKLHTSATEASVVSSTDFVYGINPHTSGEALNYWRTIDKMIDVTPSTDYYALVERVSSPIACSIFEVPSMTENFDGYMAQNIVAQGPILDIYRSNHRELATMLWNESGSRLFSWTTDPGSFVGLYGLLTNPEYNYKKIASVTPTNVLDGSSTVVAASTPGFTLDLTGKLRVSQASTGVPCMIKAFGKMSAGTGGDVYLVNSAGTIVAGCGVVAGDPFTTTPSWKELAFTLPTTQDKYDLFFCSPTGGTFSLWAVSAWEQD
jgi:hypothetical protein